ncbi:hypothetical protein [Streptomyces sp. NBC_01314]|uniref:hypothetical protein n=1 Tax=Streptomyces sp. NBC_01314 TaxID=2903821 RepID=UPI00308E2CCD|nr:hypothetical protein OG622_08660 [Streptomyces sp. NBC_01314]
MLRVLAAWDLVGKLEAQSCRDGQYDAPTGQGRPTPTGLRRGRELLGDDGDAYEKALTARYPPYKDWGLGNDEITDGIVDGAQDCGIDGI